jgi:hypothetical protein
MAVVTNTDTGTPGGNRQPWRLMTAAIALSSKEPSPPALLSPAVVGRPRLRVGVVIDSYCQPQWISNVIRDIRRSSTSEIVAVIIDDVSGSHPIRPRSIFGDRSHLLYSLYSKFDQRFFPIIVDPLAPCDISAMVDGCASVTLASPSAGCDMPLCNRDVERILAQCLDVLLHFGSRTLRGEALGVAKYGVWAYRLGADHMPANGLIGFWEVMKQQPLTGVELCVLSEDFAAEKVIYRSSARTHPRSVRRNRTSALSKASAFAIRKLRDLQEDGPAALESGPTHKAHKVAQTEEASLPPTNALMLRLFSGLIGRYLASRLRYFLGSEQWFLAYSLQQPSALDRVPLRAPPHMVPLLPPKDRFWADPFPVRKQGGYYVFFEERPFLTRKGFLSVLEIDDAGHAGAATKVLERDHHLSYPFVFEWEGQHFLLPESAGNKSVDLYRAEEFPYRWKFDRVLLKDVNAVDATLHHFRNRWWMFVNIALPGASSCDELHIYHAETPTGPWTPHPRNPIKSDASNARPAGRIFMHAGQLYRPAQDCSTRYGGSITINRIVRLDLEGYKEMEVSKILPDWQPNLIATHTINSVDQLIVMDAKRIRPRWPRSG